MKPTIDLLKSATKGIKPMAIMYFFFSFFSEKIINGYKTNINNSETWMRDPANQIISGLNSLIKTLSSFVFHPSKKPKVILLKM